MTLTTRVYVNDEIDRQSIWAKCNELIEAGKSNEFKDEPYPGDGGTWWMWNRAGQGWLALLDLKYQPEGPLRTPEKSAEHDEYCNLPGEECYDPEEGPCTGKHHSPACWLELSFDTPYGYRDANGGGCGDLHARLVAELGQWLDAQNVSWSWENEFTGDVHTGYARLIDLCSGGFEASAWFSTSVLPAINAVASKES